MNIAIFWHILCIFVVEAWSNWAETTLRLPSVTMHAKALQELNMTAVAKTTQQACLIQNFKRSILLSHNIICSITVLFWVSPNSTDNGLFTRGWLYSRENLWFWDTYKFDLIWLFLELHLVCLEDVHLVFICQDTAMAPVRWFLDVPSQNDTYLPSVSPRANRSAPLLRWAYHQRRKGYLWMNQLLTAWMIIPTWVEWCSCYSTSNCKKL